MLPSILIIDDEISFIEKMRLSFGNFKFLKALNTDQSFSLINKRDFDLILLDLKLDPNSEKLDGLDLIQPIKKTHTETPLVVITSDEKTETVVTAMKLGADDFLRKSDFDLLSWRKKFELLVRNKKLSLENKFLIENENQKYPFIGNSRKIKEVKRTLKELAGKPEITVLITGETGVGKEVAARYIHRNSDRKDKPFVNVNLSSIQPTLLESSLFGHRKGSFTGADYSRKGFFRKADKGVLFLDEIGDIDSNIQVKILNFLETKTIQVVGNDEDIQLDIQIIVATNKDLSKMVSENLFREDLYYRIKNFKIDIPPLRERKEDLEKILEYYIRQNGYTNIDEILDVNAKTFLLEYNWPGNVRELKNTVDSMLLKARIKGKPIVDIDCLPEEIRLFSVSQKDIKFSKSEETDSSATDIDYRLAEAELSAIEEALKKTYGQKQSAAELLGMNADQLRYRILKWLGKKRINFNDYPAITKYYKIMV